MRYKEYRKTRHQQNIKTNCTTISYNKNIKNSQKPECSTYDNHMYIYKKERVSSLCERMKNDYVNMYERVHNMRIARKYRLPKFL